MEHLRNNRRLQYSVNSSNIIQFCLKESYLMVNRIIDKVEKTKNTNIKDYFIFYIDRIISFSKGLFVRKKKIKEKLIRKTLKSILVVLNNSQNILNIDPYIKPIMMLFLNICSYYFSQNLDLYDILKDILEVHYHFLIYIVNSVISDETYRLIIEFIRNFNNLECYLGVNECEEKLDSQDYGYIRKIYKRFVKYI